MPNNTKDQFLEELAKRFGPLKKLEHTRSLFETSIGGLRFYVRYSSIHRGNRTWYGLRQEDLQAIEGHHAFMCFLWEGQVEPLIVPFAEYEDVFQTVLPATDGQYKVQVYLNDDGTDLYIARAGRFGVEGYFGWNGLPNAVSSTSPGTVPEISHAQAQTLLGAIGVAKGHDIWIPFHDRAKLDWSFTSQFGCRTELPHGFEEATSILREIDVIWIKKGSNQLTALFEVEHSTPIYSGLLRFNDIHILAPNLRPRFSIVANDARRSAYVRQLHRPTFRASGLNEMCSFLEYVDVFGWHARTIERQAE